MTMEKTPAEMEKEEKEKTYLDDVEVRKANLQNTINQLNAEQEDVECRLLDIQIEKKKYQDILDELETRYPVEEPE